MKCDEEKPYCRRCISTGRKCDGYINAPLPRKGLGPSANAKARLQATSQSPSPPPLVPHPSELTFANDRESQCFDFFRHCTVPQTNLYVDSNFWARDILQAPAAEPAIKHGVLALAALHRHVDSGAESERQFAMQHYAQAVSLVGSRLKQQQQDGLDLNFLLISVVIFHCFENQMGNRKAAALHLKAASNLASESRGTERGESSRAMRSQPGIDRVLRTMRRLDVHDLTNSDANAPYEWESDWIPAQGLPDLPAQIEDFDEARDTLMVLFKRANHLTAADFIRSVGQDPGIGLAELARIRDRTLTDLSQWLESYRQLRDPESAARPPGPHVSIIIDAYHRIAVMKLTVLATQQEITWDVFVPQCSTLVESFARLLDEPTLAEQMDVQPFVYDLGIIAPLFWIAFKCRHPVIRRQAISLLSRAPRQEGSWDSSSAAAVTHAVVTYEEAGLRDVSEAQDIPERQRVHHVQPRKDHERRTIECLFLTKSSGLQGPWKSMTQTLEY